MSQLPNVFAIVQARMSSTRLPGKVLLELVPHVSVLEFMLERVSRSKEIGKTIVATTENPNDKVLAERLKRMGQPYFVGSENDVLDRYYQAAKKFGAKSGDAIVRITSDCPVIDPEIIDKTIRFYKEGNFDYATNNREPYVYPDGMDTEVCSFDALEKAWKEATKLSHREHVTFHFWMHQDLFKVGQYGNEKLNQGDYRLTLDYPSDYELLKRVCEHFAPRRDFTMQEIIDFLDAHPEVKALNADVARNAAFKTA